MTRTGTLRLRRTRAGLWLAALALLLQTVMPAAHYGMGLGLDRAALKAEHALCLAPGEVPPAEHDKAPVHKLPPCPICQTFQMLGAGYAPPAEIAVEPPHGIDPVVHAVLASTNLQRRTPGGVSARGPPVSL
ncbi:MAG TPA: DUF2946 family protein [Alphaproteobacteria bacterium]|jgi:hypothetical protein|nr:DUF2946 family protein [Alphaproteobacteria bacterium]